MHISAWRDRHAYMDTQPAYYCCIRENGGREMARLDNGAFVVLRLELIDTGVP